MEKGDVRATASEGKLDPANQLGLDLRLTSVHVIISVENLGKWSTEGQPISF